MSYITGRIFADPSIPSLPIAERRAMWTSALQTLAALHAVDIAKLGLDTYGKNGGFYTRQIRTLNKIQETQARDAGEIPYWNELMRALSNPARMPTDRTVLMHGDFKIDNIIFHHNEPRVIGILDWELSTLGHPLADISNLLGPYVTEDTFEPVMSAEEAVGVYETAAGWGVGGRLKWGLAFGVVRNAVITQGITARSRRGQASSARAGEYEKITPKLAGLAKR